MNAGTGTGVEVVGVLHDLAGFTPSWADLTDPACVWHGSVVAYRRRETMFIGMPHGTSVPTARFVPPDIGNFSMALLAIRDVYVMVSLALKTNGPAAKQPRVV